MSSTASLILAGLIGLSFGAWYVAFRTGSPTIAAIAAGIGFAAVFCFTTGA